MKHGVIIAIAAIAMVGAASVNFLTTSSYGAASSLSAPPKVPLREVPQAASGAQLAAPRIESASLPVPAAVLRKASLDVRQAPVPLQVKPRPPVNLPAADAPAAGAPGASAKTEAVASAPAATDNKFSETAVRAAIQADGYKGVQVLRKGVNGMWHAKAMRGTTEVLLAVDSSGNVTTGD